jgi:hypothetical protein
MTQTTTKIEVLDAVMGSGKTTGIISWMIKNPQNKYLYVSPMLTEIEERIPTACESLEFTFPNTEQFHSKSEHLLHLLKQGCNISFTHSLFSDMTKEHLWWVEKQGYVLIVDEEIDFIESYNGVYGKDDIVSLEKSKHVVVDEDNLGKVSWTWNDMEGDTVYSRLKRLCDLDMLYCAKRSREMMVIHLPLELVSKSNRTILLTYLFEGSVMECFMKMRGVEVSKFTELGTYTDSEVRARAKELINFIETKTTRQVKNLSMSYKWYINSARKEELDQISKAIFSVYRKAPKGDFLFTAPKEVSTRYDDKGRKRTRTILHRDLPDEYYLYSGAKATNIYAHRSYLVHAYNRYPNLTVRSYLQDYAYPPNEDRFALSEMIQWIWRSRIRNDESINLCVLNKRMERLLRNWLDNVCVE